MNIDKAYDFIKQEIIFFTSYKFLILYLIIFIVFFIFGMWLGDYLAPEPEYLYYY